MVIYEPFGNVRNIGGSIRYTFLYTHIYVCSSISLRCFSLFQMSLKLRSSIQVFLCKFLSYRRSEHPIIQKVHIRAKLKNFCKDLEQKTFSGKLLNFFA